jgi:hypothetical protein
MVEDPQQAEIKSIITELMKTASRYGVQVAELQKRLGDSRFDQAEVTKDMAIAIAEFGKCEAQITAGLDLLRQLQEPPPPGPKH